MAVGNDFNDYGNRVQQEFDRIRNAKVKDALQLRQDQINQHNRELITLQKLYRVHPNARICVEPACSKLYVP